MREREGGWKEERRKGERNGGREGGGRNGGRERGTEGGRELKGEWEWVRGGEGIYEQPKIKGLVGLVYSGKKGKK